jgi:hypothetical protein
MEFRLVYEGPLKANGSTTAKHIIRQVVHSQLQELIDRKAMEHMKQMIEQKKSSITRLSVGPYTFIPLISEKLDHVAELHITFLTPEEPGRVITQGGDLDNRLKTLLDALRCPKNLGELPNGAAPTESSGTGQQGGGTRRRRDGVVRPILAVACSAESAL